MSYTRLGGIKLPALAVLFAFLALIGVAGAMPRQAHGLTNCSADTSIDDEEREFLRLINNYRADNHLPPLVLSESLTRASSWKSQDMAANNYFAHNDTPSGREWVQRLRDCGYEFNAWMGENIAAGNDTAAATFEQWRNSPGHNANMLSENFNAIGIGRYYRASGATFRWYWTTDFGGIAEAAGDVNCSGLADTVDAMLILQRLAGLGIALPCAGSADVNGDGSVNSTDALLVLQYAAGLVGRPD